MNNISFGSNFNFNVGRNYPSKVMDKLGQLELRGASVDIDYLPFEEACKTGVFSKISASVEDKYDDMIQTMLIQNGIDFHKQTFEDAMDIKNIHDRIQLSSEDKRNGCRLVEFDTEVLDELFKKEGIAYIKPNGENGLGNRYKGVGEYLKTGRPINATKVYFSDATGELNVGVQDGRHRFAYMRDLGMKKIPVSLDKYSYDLAKTYGFV